MPAMPVGTLTRRCPVDTGCTLFFEILVRVWLGIGILLNDWIQFSVFMAIKSPLQRLQESFGIGQAFYLLIRHLAQSSRIAHSANHHDRYGRFETLETAAQFIPARRAYRITQDYSMHFIVFKE